MIPDTVTGLFYQQALKYRDKPAINYIKGNDYTFITYGQWGEMARNVAKGLIKIGVQEADPGIPDTGDRVAILSATRMEWAVTDIGILSAGAVNVAIYDTLAPKQAAYIINDSGSKVIFVSDEIQLRKILEIYDDCPTLKEIIVFEPFDNSLKKEFIYTFQEFMDIGQSTDGDAELDKRLAEMKTEKLAALIYTSGTTGDPKGVMLTHANFTSNVRQCLTVLPVSDQDVTLSFLPLSHSFERMIGYYMMLGSGATISYAASIDTIADNMKQIHPTIIPSVPRLYEKMYTRVKAGVETGSPIKQHIFKWAFDVGHQVSEYRLAKMETEIPFLLVFKHKIADKLVFSKLKEATGGKLRYFASGGAPLAPEIARFFYDAGITILEGYGLTETTPVTHVNLPEAFKFGTVGVTVPEVEMKLADDGEILVRGPNIMRGYWNKKEDTDEVIEPDGWFHTGDIGELTEDGFLRITDRKKEIIVMSNGKNVAPQLLESALKNDRYISMAMVIGDKRKFMSALVVPDFEQLTGWLEENDVKAKKKQEIIENQKVIEFFNARVSAAMDVFARYEKVKKITLLDREFTIEKDELTPTLKLKRRNIFKHFEKQIEAMYEVK